MSTGRCCRSLLSGAAEGAPLGGRPLVGTAASVRSQRTAPALAGGGVYGCDIIAFPVMDVPYIQG